MAAIVGSSPVTMDIPVKDIPEMLKQFAKTFSEEPSQRDVIDKKIKALVGDVMKSHSQHLAVDGLNSLLKEFSSINNASETIGAKVEVIRKIAMLIEKIANPLSVDPRLAALSRAAGTSTKPPRRSIIEFPPTLSRSPSFVVSSSVTGAMSKQDAKIAELTSRVEQLEKESAEKDTLINLLKSQQNEINIANELEIGQLREDIANLSMLLQLKLGISVQKDDATPM